MSYMLLGITKTTQGWLHFQSPPFLVIDDNILIKASTNDNMNEIHRRFEKYVISKGSP